MGHAEEPGERHRGHLLALDAFETSASKQVVDQVRGKWRPPGAPLAGQSPMVTADAVDLGLVGARRDERVAHEKDAVWRE